MSGVRFRRRGGEVFGLVVWRFDGGFGVLLRRLGGDASDFRPLYLGGDISGLSFRRADGDLSRLRFLFRIGDSLRLLGGDLSDDRLSRRLRGGDSSELFRRFEVASGVRSRNLLSLARDDADDRSRRGERSGLLARLDGRRGLKSPSPVPLPCLSRLL